MPVCGEVQVRPTMRTRPEAIMHCTNNGLGKPLSECNNKEIGRYGEELAALYIESLGLSVLDRNWRCAFGEVDLVVEDGDSVVLTEVKTRTAADGDELAIMPELAVNYRKQNRYQKLALMYLSLQTKVDTVRFGVVSVKLTGECEATVRFFPNAYEWDC